MSTPLHNQSEPTPARERRRGVETAERILDAAERCFAQRGYDGTTLRHVAEGVGIRIPSLYNHFPNKQQLYSAVLERGMTPILDLLTRFVEAGDESLEQPDRVAAELMTLLGQRPELPRLLQYELLAGGDQLAEVLENWLRPTIGRGLAMLQRTPAARSWKPEQLPLLLLAFVQMVLGHFTTAPLFESLYGQNPSEPEALVRQAEFFGRLVTLTTGAAELTATSASAPSGPTIQHLPATKENRRP